MPRKIPLVIESNLRLDPERALEGVDWSREFGDPGPVEVELSLDGAVSDGDLAVHAPRALDDTKPPLSQVEFDSAADGAPACLRVRVDADQPAGVYTGVIVERATHRSCGTLTIRVPD